MLSSYVTRDAISCSDFVCRVYAKMLHLSDTSADNAAAVMSLDLSAILIKYHVGFNRFFPTANENCFLFIRVFVFLPFLHTLKPETSVADKHNDCTPVSSAPEGSRGCLLAHARHAEKRANDTTGQMVILHCVRSGKGGFLCSLFDTEGCRGRRVDVCEIHRTAASLAQWSVKLSPSSTRTPSYTFLSPLLRAVHAGLLSTALSQWSTLVITMTGTATPWQAA